MRKLFISLGMCLLAFPFLLNASGMSGNNTIENLGAVLSEENANKNFDFVGVILGFDNFYRSDMIFGNCPAPDVSGNKKSNSAGGNFEEWYTVTLRNSESDYQFHSVYIPKRLISNKQLDEWCKGKIVLKINGKVFVNNDKITEGLYRFYFIAEKIEAVI